MLTAPELQGILPECDASAWITPINTALVMFGLIRPLPMAMFLAQAGHESGQFRRLEERLNYSAERLLAVFPNRIASHREAAILAYRPAAIANRVYGGRMGNGDEASGDGYRFRGRGLLQITGRAQYAAAGLSLRQDFIRDPECVAQPEWAAKTAAWYFAERMPGYSLAESRNLEGCTRRINGGLTGLAEREAIYRRALEVLGVEMPEEG